jgi:phosphohistidine phosphatase
MRRLILLRHAKSDWPAGVEDHERPLGKRGRRDGPRIGKAMMEQGLVPAQAIISTAQRTRQTWDLVKPALGPVPERFERSIYEADPAAILKVIRATPADVPSLLIIGHNPGLELVAAFLSGHCAERAALTTKFPTGAIAVIDFNAGSWRDVGQGQGALVLFLTPAELD